MVEEEYRWLQLQITCPSCGSRGDGEGPWTHSAVAPFALVEDIARTWTFTPRTSGRDRVIVVDADRDHVDWESGVNRRLQCKTCLAEFPIPEELSVEFE